MLSKIMFAQSKLDRNVTHSKTMVELYSHSKVQLSVVFIRLMEVKKSLYYRGVSIWNSLPESPQKVNDKKVFKREIKLYNFT